MRTWFKTLTSSGGTFCKAAIVSFKVNTPCWRTTDIPGKRESLRGGIICGDGRSLSMLTALSEFFCSCIVFNWAPACNQHNTKYKMLGSKRSFLTCSILHNNGLWKILKPKFICIWECARHIIIIIKNIKLCARVLAKRLSVLVGLICSSQGCLLVANNVDSCIVSSQISL